LLPGYELPNRRRLARFLRRRGPHGGAVLETVIGPDMNDQVQRADLGVPERRQLGVLLPRRQSLGEAFLDVDQRAGPQCIRCAFR
jgi:hypothetical protein